MSKPPRRKPKSPSAASRNLIRIYPESRDLLDVIAEAKRWKFAEVACQALKALARQEQIPLPPPRETLVAEIESDDAEATGEIA